MTGNFYIDLFKVIGENIYNDHQNNYDYIRFGPQKRETYTWRRYIKKWLNQRGYYNKFEIENFAESLDRSVWIQDFEYLFNSLTDQYSKWLLLQIVAFRLLGYRKVKLPLNDEKYWEDIDRLSKYENKEDFIQTGFMKMNLYYMDLSLIDIPLKFYFTGPGVNSDFIIKQYDFERENIKIGVTEGDIVVDGGGCWGDTALYFSIKTGKSGSVHSFEFIPDNIVIWEKNIGLNPELRENIFLANNPLWSNSGVNVFFESNGPGSKVSFEEFVGYDGIVQTISIDNYVVSKGLNRVDFIKLDIEGAELAALKGANQTLNDFKPKLAIALYHRTEDFYSIPKYLEGLNLGYKFYLSHSTIHEEETVLFAIATHD
jgi:FkbM family methyltransferase